MYLSVLYFLAANVPYIRNDDANWTYAYDISDITNTLRLHSTLVAWFEIAYAT